MEGLHRYKLFALPLAVLVAGWLITWQQWHSTRERDEAYALAEFSRYIEHMHYGLEQRLKANAQILLGVGALFATGEPVTRQRFRDYARTLQLDRTYPGIQGVGFSQFFTAGGLARHQARLRAEGFPDYLVRPPGEREDYSAIIYLEPFDWRNQRAFGYDMYSEPVRQAAMRRAALSGLPAMTERVVLVQETDRDVQAGFLVYVPVYRPGARLDTAEERHAALLGWAYSPLRMQDLMEQFLALEHADHRQRLTLQIYDGGSPAPERLMYRNAPPAESARGLPVVTETLHFGGGTWTLVASPVPHHAPWLSRQSNANTLLGAGIALSLLLATVSFLLVRQQTQALVALEETRAANRQLAEKETLIRTIYDSSSVGIFLIDTSGHITHANRRMSELFLCPHEQLIGSEYVAHVHPAERAAGRERMLQVLAQHLPSVDVERRYRRKDDTEFWGHLTGRPLLDAGGRVQGLVGVIADVSDRKKSEAASELARIVFEASPEGIMVTDAANRIISVNPAFVRITGYRPEEVIGRNPRILASGRQSPDYYDAMWQQLSDTGHWEGELWNRRHDGHLYPEWLSITRVTARDGITENYIAIFQDITARRQAEERIRYLAHHDYLTGLPNRAYFVDHMAQALAMARRYERRLGILFIDLDRFKPINDQYGHDAGDAVLKEAARRFVDAVRESDMVCRQGGDEFLILVPEVGSPDSLENLAQKLLRELGRPITWNGEALTLGCSIGIATYPECGTSVDDLIQAADTAMYQAKADPGHPVAVARPVLQ